MEKNVINLSVGDIFKITVHKFNVTSSMSILERTVANIETYIRYNGDGIFEEIKPEQNDRRYYITIYRGY